MSFQQQVFLPSRVQFIAGKQSLHDFEQAHPGLEPLIHSLLRTYEGIFDQPVPIYEKNLAFTLRKDRRAILTDLQQLHAWRIIDYAPQKESPQLYFFRDRPNAEELYIEPIGYLRRKEQYATRIEAMLGWLEMKEGCRSRRLAQYFGDMEAGDCGICDHCLRRHAIPVPPATA